MTSAHLPGSPGHYAPILPGDEWPLITPAGLRPGTRESSFVLGAMDGVTSGCFVLTYGIAAVASSHVLTAHAHDVFGSPNSRGWITLVIGVLRLLAAAGC
jgi:hypothetical protein